MKALAGFILVAVAAGAALVALLGRSTPVPPAGPAPATAPATRPAEGPTVYRTARRLEPDTCVAAWLLTRVVSPGARAVAGDDVPGAVPFDLPNVPLSRQPGKCVSRVVCEKYGITDEFALALAAIAQELELTPWTLNADPLFERVRGGLGEAVNASPSEQECLEQALTFLDQVQAEYPAFRDSLRRAEGAATRPK